MKRETEKSFGGLTFRRWLKRALLLRSVDFWLAAASTLISAGVVVVGVKIFLTILQH